MAVLERRVTCLQPVAIRFDRSIKVDKELFERITKTFIVPTRIAACGSSVGIHQSRISKQQLVGRVAMADLQLIGRLAIPGERLT